MKAEQFSPDVVDFVQLLEKHQVRYLLIGGYAVFYHGYTRLTADVDFAYDPALANAERLYLALSEFGNGYVPGVADPSELAEAGMVFQFGRPPNRIDLLSRVAGVDFAAAWQRRVEAAIQHDSGSIPLAIISLPDLRDAKAAAGRPKDLDDLANLPAG